MQEVGAREDEVVDHSVWRIRCGNPLMGQPKEEEERSTEEDLTLCFSESTKRNPK